MHAPRHDCKQQMVWLPNAAQRFCGVELCRLGACVTVGNSSGIARQSTSVVTLTVTQICSSTVVTRASYPLKNQLSIGDAGGDSSQHNCLRASRIVLRCCHAVPWSHQVVRNMCSPCTGCKESGTQHQVGYALRTSTKGTPVALNSTASNEWGLVTGMELCKDKRYEFEVKRARGAPRGAFTGVGLDSPRGVWVNSAAVSQADVEH